MKTIIAILIFVASFCLSVSAQTNAMVVLYTMSNNVPVFNIPASAVLPVQYGGTGNTNGGGGSATNALVQGPGGNHDASLVTNLNASALASGTLPLALMPSTIISNNILDQTYYSIAIGNGAAATLSGVAIGYGANAPGNATSVGDNANATAQGVAIGNNSDATQSGAALGQNALSANYGVALGYFANGAALGNVAIGENANAVSSGFTNTIELGSGTATLPGALNIWGTPLMDSNRFVFGAKFFGGGSGLTNLAGTVPSSSTTNFLINVGGSGVTTSVPLSSLPFGSGGSSSTNIASDINIFTYGGLGTSNLLDTNAFQACLNAAANNGGGTIRLPHPKTGFYLGTGPYSIPPNTKIRGDGGAYDSNIGGTGPTNAGTFIYWSGTNNNLFSFTNNVGSIEGITIVNVAATVPIGGAAIYCSNYWGNQKVDTRDITIYGGWNGIEQHSGIDWDMDNVLIYDVHNDGVLIDNALFPDAGDWHGENLYIFSRSNPMRSGIEWWGSGGIKFNNLKINGGSVGSCPTNGIMFHSLGNTSVGELTGVSIENQFNDGILFDNPLGTKSYSGMQITALEVAMYNSTGYAIEMTGGIGNHSSILGVSVKGSLHNGSALRFQGMTDLKFGGFTYDNYPSITYIDGFGNSQITNLDASATGYTGFVMQPNGGVTNSLQFVQGALQNVCNAPYITTVGSYYELYTLNNNYQDISSNQFNGSPVGSPTFVTGTNGYFALSPNTDAYMAGSTNSIASTQGTVSWWQKATSAANDGLVDEVFAQSVPGTTPEFSFQKFSDGNIYAGFNNSTDYRVVVAATSANWQLNQWEFYALTWGNGGNTLLYTNGVLCKNNGLATSVMSPGAYPLNIGAYGTSQSASLFRGLLQDFRVQQTSNTTAQVLSIFNAGPQ